MNDASDGDTTRADQPQTRKERRERRRAELRSTQRGFERRRSVWRIFSWLAVFAVIAGLGWGMAQLARRAPAASDAGSLFVPVREGENIRGPADAPLTLVEYSDFQCPACAAYQPLLEQLFAEPELDGKVRLVFRHFPLTTIHANAEQAARAAEAAALQGKFWEMHDALFASQSEWSELQATEALAKFREYASSFGTDAARWESDLSADSVVSKVAGDTADADAAGLSGTPTFFLNGVQLAPPNSYDEFKQRFLDALP